MIRFGKYKLAFYLALAITAGALCIMAAGWYLVFNSFHPGILAASLLVFGLSFIILQFSIDRFLFMSLKKIYHEVQLLDTKKPAGSPVTTDMNELSKEVEQFVLDKRLEIETLNIRENYRKEFMGNVAHELKTPLFTVQGYIMTLLDGALYDEKVNKKYLKGASKGVDRLVHIVRDLDMITQLERGELLLNRERFDIRFLLENVFALLEMEASKKKITLTFDKNYGAVFVYADRERIEQVLINLIMNSIKYGKHAGTTEVSIEDFSDSKILIRITDNGEGIEKSELPRIFERFYRVDKSGSRQQGGSGLGLSIVKHILEAHKEKIYVESQLKIGSEFSFTLEKSEKRPD